MAKINYTSYEMAGRLYRIFGWLQLVFGILFGIAVIVPYVVDEKLNQQISSLIPFAFVLIFIIGVSLFQLKLGTAIKEHKKWARTAGIVLAVLQLLGFPIGTILGAYILYCLIKRWDQ